MTIRIATTALRRTLARTALAPAAARLARPATASLSTTAHLRSKPDMPNPTHTDQGATGPSQRTSNASGPSGTVSDATLSDPYPLPFSPDIVDLNNANSGPESGPESKWAGLNLASERQTLDGVDAPTRVPGREGQDRTTKIARLVYQCRKRGTLETDLLLSTFAKKELKDLPDEELDEFDRLLDEPDWDIFYWCTQRKPVPERWHASFHTEGKLGHRLIIHTKNEEKAVRWMPEL